MDIELLQPLIKDLERSGETRDLALARVLECTARNQQTLVKVDDRLKVVEAQTIKTNGRVNNHDNRIESIESNYPKDELSKIIDDRKFLRRIFVYGGATAGIIITVFGTIMWERINYLSDLDDNYISIVVQKTLKELKITK